LSHRIQILRHRIHLSFSYRNHLNEINDYSVEFASVPDFKNYLRWEPVKGMLIGYGPVNQELLENARVSNVKLSISHDSAIVNFDNAHQLADYLKRHREIAKALSFIPASVD
jgi:hypothetical protein